MSLQFRLDFQFDPLDLFQFSAPNSKQQDSWHQNSKQQFGFLWGPASIERSKPPPPIYTRTRYPYFLLRRGIF